jgi:hypothetical protein
MSCSQRQIRYEFSSSRALVFRAGVSCVNGNGRGRWQRAPDGSEWLEDRDGSSEMTDTEVRESTTGRQSSSDNAG